jgi:tetratricopeptide (TPR) repeat protein
VYFVDIEGATEFSQVWQRIADVIGYRFFGSDAPPEQLLRVFRERRTLLILDGFEHTQLGDAQLACVTWIDKLIRQCHSLRILTTSRHRLMSAHETVVELGGLAIASGVNSDLMKERGDAIDLFLSAAARRSGDAPSLPHVARICRLVGGMPLAIEIAACWTRVMSCQRIADDIEREHGRLLRSTETPDGDPSNALRIQACLEYAWQQLMPHEQLLYAALSELDSHFDADAACFTGKTATSAIMALLDKSILHKALPSRFAMHSVIRMFGREKGRAVLVATSETQQRIIDYFIGVAQSRQADPDQLNLECENFSTALRLAQAHQRWRTLLDLVSLIAEHWYLRSRYSDAALGHALAEEAARQLSDRKALLQALRWQGRMQLEQGAYQRAERMLEEALGHAYSEEDELEIGLVHYDQAWCAIETGHGDRADALIAQSLELLQPGQHDYARAQVYNLASRRLLDRNDIAGAIQSAQSAVTLLEPINAWAHLAHAYKWLAEAYQADKNWEESRRWTTRALETSTHAQDAFAVASCKYVAARLQYLTASELESGLKLALEAQAEFARIGVPKSAAYAQDLAGLLNAKLGNLIEARRLIAHSLDQIVAMDDTWATVNLRMHLGDVERDLGKLGAARQLWQTALDTARAIEHPFVDALNERLAAQHG